MYKSCLGMPLPAQWPWPSGQRLPITFWLLSVSLFSSPFHQVNLKKEARKNNAQKERERLRAKAKQKAKEKELKEKQKMEK
eukprot:scaffold469279_cov31-Prasinocladus_malaysianus.AAC.1